MVKLIIYCLSIALVIATQVEEIQVANSKTCVVQQNCNLPYPGYKGTCKNPKDKDNPKIDLFEPKKLKDFFSKVTLKKICPFLDTNGPLCCNDDQVKIISSNYQSIDSVFGREVPMCGINLKKLWCNYACNPQQFKFVNGTGYKEQAVYGKVRNLTKVKFSVNEDMACQLYKSCRGVSLVAQASIQSPKAFLDFLGVNGQNQSLSIITFQFEPLSNSTSKNNSLPDNQDSKGGKDITPIISQSSSRSSLIDGNDDVISHPFVGKPLYTKMYPCNQKIPEDGIIDGYTNVKPSKCNNCREVCPKPQIDSRVGFFDGMDIVKSILYLLMGIAFSVVYQVYNCLYQRPRILLEYQKLIEEDQKNEQEADESQNDKLNSELKTKDQGENQQKPKPLNKKICKSPKSVSEKESKENEEEQEEESLDQSEDQTLAIN